MCAIAAVTKMKGEIFMLYSMSYAMHLTVNTFVRFKYYLKYSELKSFILAYLKGLFFVLFPSVCMQYIVFKEYPSIGWILVYLVALFGADYLIMLERRHYKKEKISIENGLIHMQIVALFIAIMGGIEYICII